MSFQAGPCQSRDSSKRPVATSPDSPMQITPAEWPLHTTIGVDRHKKPTAGAVGGDLRHPQPRRRSTYAPVGSGRAFSSEGPLADLPLGFRGLVNSA
jgi:hypothetical protein